MRGSGKGIGPMLVRAACLAAAASVVGCGAVARTGSPGMPGAPGSTGVVAANHPVSASSPAEPAQPAGRVNPSAWAVRQARTVARRLLARQPVPPGAQPRGHHPAALRPAETLGGFGGVISMTNVYLVPDSRAVVLGFLRAHVPAGAANVATGTSSTGSVAERFVAYMQSATPDGVAGTLVVASTLPAGADRTWLRLDAMVVWTPPRSPAERIDPARYRAVVVTDRPRLNLPSMTRIFTAPSVIARLAALLNGMHAAGGAMFCPYFVDGFRLRFEPKPGQASPVAATAAPCGSVQITVGGRAQPLLTDSTGLGQAIVRLLGFGVGRPGHRGPRIASGR